jgi:hypothetical protein
MTSAQQLNTAQYSDTCGKYEQVSRRQTFPGKTTAGQGRGKALQIYRIHTPQNQNQKKVNKINRSSDVLKVLRGEGFCIYLDYCSIRETADIFRHIKPQCLCDSFPKKKNHWSPKPSKPRNEDGALEKKSGRKN